jgi:hypothetical protein
MSTMLDVVGLVQSTLAYYRSDYILCNSRSGNTEVKSGQDAVLSSRPIGFVGHPARIRPSRSRPTHTEQACR